MGNSQKISNWGTNFHSISLTWSCILFFETLDSKCCRICPTMALVKLPGITGFLLFWVITLIQKACKLERVKERDFHNTVLESHIYRQFLWYFRGENLFVWFSLLFTRGNGGVTGNCLVLLGEQVLELATGHTNPSYREYTLVVCCTSCIDNQVYKVKLKRNHKLMLWHCMQPVNSLWFVRKWEYNVKVEIYISSKALQCVDS